MENNTSICPNCSAWHLTALRSTEHFPCLLPTLAWTFWFLLCLIPTCWLLSCSGGKKMKGKRTIKGCIQRDFCGKTKAGLLFVGAGGQYINTWDYWVIRVLSYPLFPSFLLAFSICFLVIWGDKGLAKGIIFITRGQRKRVLQKQAINLLNFY